MNQRGFTLLELIIVILLLGVIGAGITGFIRFGALIFTDASDRQQLLASSRFVVERLNRELRNALPNSARIINSGGVECLEFMPINTSTYYDQLPVGSQSADHALVFAPQGYQSHSGQSAVVYPLQPQQVYQTNSGRIYPLKDIVVASPPELSRVNFNSAVSFAADSPAHRMFIVNQPVSYCLRNQQLWRYSGYGVLPNQTTDTALLDHGSLMADNLANNVADSAEQLFTVVPPSLVRNGNIQVHFIFSQNDETLQLYSEVHIANAP